MATELLHCCICPKLPDFSDTSHLLTHVSSKGHLSHLHKLQVRSHQEIAAGRQLAAYNEWYSKHSIAQLLSERMQHKEQKQARKRADNAHRCRKTRQPRSVVDPSLLPSDSQLPVIATDVSTTRLTLAGHSLNQEDRENALCGSQGVCGTENHRNVVTNENYLPDTAVEHGAPETCSSSRSENAGLKGAVWPGMDMFDSADHETQRKRNQRKDGSVLERMRRMSSLIEPTETVHSPGGTIKKKRHIDDLEDDSPVEGETVMVRHPLKRKRKPLSTIDANTQQTTPRNTRKSSTTYEYVATPFRRTSSIEKAFHHDLASPATGGSISALLEHPASTHRRSNFFAIYGDPYTSFGNTVPAGVHANPLFESAMTCKQHSPPTPIHPAWTRSASYTDSSYDPFKEYRETQLMCSESSGYKENVNPLVWERDLKPGPPLPSTAAFETFDDFDSTAGSLAHVYAFTKSSLADADNMDLGQLFPPTTPQGRLTI